MRRQVYDIRSVKCFSSPNITNPLQYFLRETSPHNAYILANIVGETRKKVYAKLYLVDRSGIPVHLNLLISEEMFYAKKTMRFKPAREKHTFIKALAFPIGVMTDYSDAHTDIENRLEAWISNNFADVPALAPLVGLPIMLV